MPPLVWSSGHDIYVPVEQQRRSLPFASGTGGQVRAFGISSQESGFDGALFEGPRDELETGALVARRIGRVEPNQLPEELYGICNRPFGPGVTTTASRVVRLPRSHEGDDRGWQ